jgi:type II secretory ATPase GspE/PulE/Tfp pilus assembly ATPase PilB-like protein
MPVFGGEKAVLHLTKKHGKPVDLSKLGFWGDGLTTLKNTLANPHGLLVVAGPRHSGVSTTIFSLLKDLNSPLLSVATVEIEPKHRLPGVSQTYLPNHLSIQAGLKAALKQDPNIVMIDNLPDGQSAEMAVHAATTGHMVLTGLHAESSIAALLHLRHSGVAAFSLVTALKAAVGQRLVRTLCPECRERYAISPQEREQFEAIFGIASVTARKRVHELERAAAPSIFGDVKQLNSSATHITHAWRANEAGCQACDHSGYRGRTAIVEVLKNDETLHKILLGKEILTATAIQTLLLKDGFIPMGLDGLIKALRGQTTIIEVLRAMSA